MFLGNLASLVCDVDQWLSGRVSTLHSVVTGSIISKVDPRIHCWWDLIRSKQLSRGSVLHAQVFAGFSGHGNSIYNIIPLPKKRKCTEWRSLKKKRLIWLIFVWKVWVICVCVPKFVCYWMLVCLCICCHLHVHMCICLHIYWNASLYIYTYFHYLLVGRNRTKMRVWEEKRGWGRRKWLVAIRISFSL